MQSYLHTGELVDVTALDFRTGAMCFFFYITNPLPTEAEKVGMIKQAIGRQTEPQGKP